MIRYQSVRIAEDVQILFLTRHLVALCLYFLYCFHLETSRPVLGPATPMNRHPTRDAWAGIWPKSSVEVELYVFMAWSLLRHRNNLDQPRGLVVRASDY